MSFSDPVALTMVDPCKSILYPTVISGSRTINKGQTSMIRLENIDTYKAFTFLSNAKMYKETGKSVLTNIWQSGDSKEFSENNMNDSFL